MLTNALHLLIFSVRTNKRKKSLTQIGLAHSAGQIRAAGDMIEVLRLHLLLVRLAVVEVVEVGHDDRHRQRDGEHTSDCA